MSFSYSPKLITNGMILCVDAANTKSYPTTGLTWLDLSRINTNGLLTNGPTFNSSNNGNILLDGVNDYIEFGIVPTLQFTNTQPFTLSIWCKWTSGPVVVYSYALLSSNNRGYYLGIDNGSLGVGTNCFYFDYYDGSTFRGIQSATNSISTNNWFNIVATSSTNSYTGMKLYLNGNILSTGVRAAGGGTPTSINYSTLTAQLGARQGSYTFRGNISQTNVYNRELSSSEVLQNYNAIKSRFGLS